MLGRIIEKVTGQGLRRLCGLRHPYPGRGDGHATGPPPSRPTGPRGEVVYYDYAGAPLGASVFDTGRNRSPGPTAASPSSPWTRHGGLAGFGPRPPAVRAGRRRPDGDARRSSSRLRSHSWSSARRSPNTPAPRPRLRPRLAGRGRPAATPTGGTPRRFPARRRSWSGRPIT
ncbi:MAG: hypothetical protein M0C28_11435 [Candidatus Moduliflexus flocculans]|nr:hypothetical protein [Candidatus Moduliflexus flocculans]